MHEGNPDLTAAIVCLNVALCSAGDLSKVSPWICPITAERLTSRQPECKMGWVLRMDGWPVPFENKLHQLQLTCK